MTLLVDTSVWSLALRRDTPPDVAEVGALRAALGGGEVVLTTGLILQELVQGALPSAAKAAIIERFQVLELLVPSRADHLGAAEVRNTCRRAGVQLGTVDALIAALALTRDLVLLTADQDFHHAARHVDLRIWGRPSAGQ